MASLPPLTQLLGNHGPLLEGYWTFLDSKNTGKIDAASAATFLKKSQLREPILHKIWNLSDPEGRGWLDKQGVFMALRMIAVCQAGKDPSVSNLSLTDPPPKIVGVDVVPVTNKWTIEASEKTKYEKVFQSLQPSKGLLGGDRAKPFMMTTKLPVDVLGKVWNLSDIDKDGSLDLDEFYVAMKLMALAGAKEVLPATLPASLIPASKTSASSAPPTNSTTTTTSTSGSLGGGGATSILPTTLGRASPNPSSSPAHSSPVPPRKVSPYSSMSSLVAGDEPEWVVTADLKTKYDGYFQGIDKDHDGYISGDEARNLFMASNLASNVLAHVWNLCDMENTGRLNSEQFALAMYLIAEKVRKKDIPQELTTAMIPPSLRGKVKAPSPPTTSTSSAPQSSFTSSDTTSSAWGQMTASFSGMNGGGVSSSVVPPTSSAPSDRTMKGFSTDFSAIQELDSITNEIQSIRKEKVELSEDVKIKQELVQQRKVELENLQGGVSSASEQREKLEKDREDASKLLEQLEAEKAKYESELAQLKQNCLDEEEEIGKLKQQLSEQETSKRSQEEELHALKEQLEQLKKEEAEYKQKVDLNKIELEKLQKQNQSVQVDVTQVRQKIETLKEEHQSLTTALTLYPPTNITPGSTPSSSVININDVGQLSSELHVPHLSEHDAVSARATVGSSSPVSSLSGFSTNSHLDEGPEEGGAKEDKVRVDPFASTSSSSSAADPFTAFSLPTNTTASSDPFGGQTFSGKPSDLSAFDPFGGTGDPFKTSAAPATGEEFFKSDPFSNSSSGNVSKTPSVVLTTSSATTAPTTTSHTVDPFSGQDPFHSDPFATSTSTNDKQGFSSWDTTGGFDVDPFGQQTVRTPTDPFAGDPFGEDPFGLKTSEQGGGASSNGGTNPFGGGGNIFDGTKNS